MWGVSESREPIKGEFAKRLIALVEKMRKRKLEKQEELRSEAKEKETFYNIIIKDESIMQ